MEQTHYALHNACKRFASGDEIHAYSFMGCHKEQIDGVDGFVFRVWAPNARQVSLVGDWNAWQPEPMQAAEFGIWEAFSPRAKVGDAYKYFVHCQDGSVVYKADPYAFASCAPPDTASRIALLDNYPWQDEAYRRRQGKRKLLDCPMNIYEVHLGSWKRKEDGSPYSYEDLARELVPYVKDMGYSHIELMPVAEHLDAASGGFRATGYYAPTARYGEPEDFMRFVDACHEVGIGVLLDWMPSHFPKDEHGLAHFDGGFCYESEDPMMREFSAWDACAFDLTKGEVQSFLISNAVFWLEMYHIDGIRADAVSSLLYLDYGRCEYRPNRYGGKENIDAIAFLRKLNRAVFAVRRNAITCAEESTAFPMVTKPDYDGGLGFLYKWNALWLQGLREYMQLDPLWRKGSHERLTAPMCYAYAENYVLTLSHDAVGKQPLMQTMPGKYDDKFSNLRLLYGFMMAHPGKKLSFMGSELAPFDAWQHDKQLDWSLLAYERHRQMQCFVRELNHFYLDNSPLWNNDTEPDGFAWISTDDCDNSVIALRRLDRRGREVIVILNFCPVVREHYRLGLPRLGEYEPVLNSDDLKYGGSGTPLFTVLSEKIPMHGQPYSGEFTLAPLSATFYKRKVTPRKNKES